MFVRSAGSHAHAGPLLSKCPEVKVRLRTAGAHVGPKGGSVDDLHIIINRIIFPFEQLSRLTSARQLYVVCIIIMDN